MNWKVWERWTKKREQTPLDEPRERSIEDIAEDARGELKKISVERERGREIDAKIDKARKEALDEALANLQRGRAAQAEMEERAKRKS